MSLFDPTLFPLKPKKSIYRSLRFPIQLGSVLLKRSHSVSLLETIQLLLPRSLYTQYYYSAIEQFANYVQILPSRDHQAFSDITGLLDYGLSRATYMLIASLNYLYPAQKNFHDVNYASLHAAELYAAFTAALFKDMSALIRYYEITLYDRREKKLTIWHPFERSLTTIPEATFLSFHYLDKLPPLNLSNACLVSTILSNHQGTQPGFLSITKHPKLLEMWLEALAEENQRIPPQTIMALLPAAEEMAIAQRLQASTYTNAKTRKIDKASNLGDQFLIWLQQEIQSNRLAVNADDAVGVRRTSEGVWVARAELLRFSNLRKVNIEAVEKAFKSIVMQYPISTNEYARQSVGFGGTAQAMMGQWLLAHNPALIFGMGQLPPFFTSPHLSPYSKKSG